MASAEAAVPEAIWPGP